MLEALDTISGQLRDAACDAEAWTPALDSINAFVDGSGAVLLSVDERLRHAPASSDLAELIDDYFENGWYAHDRRERCRPSLEKNGITFDHECLDISEIEAFHSEFLAKHNCKWFAGVAANLSGDLWCLSLQRSVGKGPFLEADVPRLVAVRARLEETASFARVVSRHWLDGAISALDGEGTAAIVVDRAGRILQMNEAGKSIVLGSRKVASGASRRPGLQSSKRFEDLLRSKLLEASRGAGFVRRMPLEINGGLYTLEATSLLGKASLVFSNASLLVRIYPQSPDPEGALRRKYRLTRSESRVAMALASGMDIEGMAQAFKVSHNTVRAQLKVAFAKTEMGSQAKLVALIAHLGRQ